MPNGATTRANVGSKIQYNLRELTISADMFPLLKHNSLMSGCKFADEKIHHNFN